MRAGRDRLTIVTDEVMALPHVVYSIAQYARTDRTTIFNLMRTNRNLYALVGPVLYDTVAVWENNFDSFFHGAFNRSTDDHSAYGSPICNLVDNVTGEHVKFPEFENKAPFRTYWSGRYTAGTTLPLSKRELLSFVRVLTLGSHHSFSCAVWYTSFRKYVTNVEVFRIVDTPVHDGVTAPICSSPDSDTGVPETPCPIISAINPRKLVLRNLSHRSLPFPPLWSLNSNTKEVVFIIPTVEAYLHDRTVSWFMLEELT